MTTRPTRRVRAALVALIVAAVAVTASPAAGRTGPPEHAQRRFDVMTYNLYLGANLTPLFGKTGLELLQEAAKVFAHVGQTDFPARAEAIAALIAERPPEVIGLQEVALWETAPLTQPDQLVPAYDFLDILLDALADAGVPYHPVATNVNFSGALPISFTTLASFTDRDVIIVRSGLRTSQLKASNSTSQNFQATLPVPLGGEVIQAPRGWSTIDVKFRGKSYRVANTHLEAFSALVRNLQAQELAASLATSPLPVVLVGDINSEPDDATGAWGIMLGAGFVDAWVEAMGDVPGFTAGQTDDLDNVPSTIDHTVDYVMHNRDGFVDAVTSTGEIVGEELGDRTPGGLWPSDHAAVVVTMHIAKP